MKSATIAAFAQVVSYSFTTAYLITGDNVNCRAGPSTSFSVIKTYARGQDVSLTCQTEGLSVFGTSIWDKTSDGCYVSDYYVKTGSTGYVTGKCTTCASPAANQATVDLIATWEDFIPTIYPDINGNPTVGYGHLCADATCSDVKYPIPLSQADGKALFAQDLALFEQCIFTITNEKVTLNMNQYGALVSWSFNVGCPGAGASTLIRRLNNNEDPKVVIPEELPKWVYGDDGKVIQGLVNRREAEIAFSEQTTNDKALPVAC